RGGHSDGHRNGRRFPYTPAHPPVRVAECLLLTTAVVCHDLSDLVGQIHDAITLRNDLGVKAALCCHSVTGLRCDESDGGFPVVAELLFKPSPGSTVVH